MLGKKSCVNRLAAQKQLLIAESENNRVQLGQDWQSLTNQASGIIARAKTYNGIVTSVISLVAAVDIFKQATPAATPTKTSWLHKISNAVKLASTIWPMFRPGGSASKKE